MITDGEVMRCAVFELLGHGMRLSVHNTAPIDAPLYRCDDGDKVIALLSSMPEAVLVAIARNGRTVGMIDFEAGKITGFSDSILFYLSETLGLMDTRDELEQGTWG